MTIANDSGPRRGKRGCCPQAPGWWGSKMIMLLFLEKAIFLKKWVFRKVFSYRLLRPYDIYSIIIHLFSQCQCHNIIFLNISCRSGVKFWIYNKWLIIDKSINNINVYGLHWKKYILFLLFICILNEEKWSLTLSEQRQLYKEKERMYKHFTFDQLEIKVFNEA